MLRTKKDVDRHVQEIFRKLQDENERTLRCYKIAELYYNVGDVESARRYLSRYVEVRKEAKAHKLMGQILEALGQKEAALIQYKFAFELDGRQEDLVLKMCELMADPDVGIDVNRAKYWVDRAEKLFPRHKVVFQLREKILSIERPTNSEEDLVKLITAELASRPSDVHLRVKLLKHYMEKNKLDEAYKHATEIEAMHVHRDSLLWYQVLCELFLKCKANKQVNWNFWITYISALERYAALSLKEQGSLVKKTSEAIQAVYNFDQHLYEAKAQSFSSYPSLTENIYQHMWGQLHFHLACLLLQNTQREQSSWAEAGRLCAPLLLAAMHIKPIDLTASWAMHLDNNLKSQLQIWYREGSYRCSQAGHVLHDYSRGNHKKLMSDIEKFSTGSWRERVYQRIFVGKIYQKIRTSYFTNNNALSPPLRLISSNELKRYDQVAEEVWPFSLHHQIWPAVKSRSTSNINSNKHDGPQPNLSTHLFPELQFSVYNLNQASPHTLSQLDVDAFLNAAVLCACAAIEDHHQNKFLSLDRLPTLPADLTSPLCSDDQEKWWQAAYRTYRKEVIDDIGETRQHLQRGLEVVRGIGNHGLHPIILVHLARVFSYRTKQLKEKNSESSDIPALEARCELYWSAAVPLLERLQNNQTIRSSNIKLFEYVGRDMNNMELTNAIEEGKLLLAQKLVKDKLYEQAIEALKALKCPEASFEQGKIYKILADELMNDIPKESVTSEIRSQHVIILSKARNSFYLTLDRLRSPEADPKHPLNAELCTEITAIENELKRIDPDTLYSDRHRNDCDDYSEESYSSAHSDEHPLVINSLPVMNNSNHHTPMRNIRRTPKQSSTPRHQQEFLDVSRNRIEVRPSPERLDAQIRMLVHSIESLKEQNREQNRAIISKLDELIKVNSRKDTEKLQAPPPVSTQNLEDELYGMYGEEDYRDFNNYNAGANFSANARTPTVPRNLFATPAAAAPRHPYSPLVYPNPYYQAAGHMPFPDPTAAAAAMSALYPAAAAAAAAGVYGPMPSLYPRGLDQQAPIASMQQMTENLQQGLFGQRLGEYPQNLPPTSSLSQLQQPLIQQQQPLIQQQQPLIQQQQPLVQQQQPLGQQQVLSQHIGQLNIGDTSKNDPKLGFATVNEPSSQDPIYNRDGTITSAGAPVTSTAARKAPPVNVVITTSDTLPTTTPTSQPMLSVTIPVQHRLGVSPASSANNLYQEMPHNYQISMPSTANIPTTVNLPPLSTTFTMTSPATRANVTDNPNSSIVSTGSRHSVSEPEVEHDPIPDFQPIIPLPDEVPVTTGEEDQEELFCARAKLFRFADKEWKERGIGNVKLLKSTDGKIRLLMRREQVHKICANHYLRKDMELTPMANNDKAYIWAANDFADEETRLEKLCIRFKTPEEAASFKESFDKAKNSLPDETEKPAEVNAKPSATSKTEQKPVAKTETPQAKPVFGGFTFSTTPSIQKPSISPDSTQKKEEPAKPSPFAAFSFTPSTKPSATSASFSFGANSTSATNSTPVFGQDSAKVAVRRPHVDSSTGVEKVRDNEIVLGEQSINLLHLVSESKTWNELGSGSIKILSEKTSGKMRLLMNNSDNTKTLLNQVVPPTLVFNLKGDSINWTLNDSKSKPESYYARFKNHDQASSFHKSLTSQQQKSGKPANAEPKPLSELFKPAPGSWECKDCYTRNQGTVSKCVSCQAPGPAASIPARPTVQSVSKNLFEQFKPAAGSWECTSCYLRNNAGVAKCVSCLSPGPAGSASVVSSTTPTTNIKPLSEVQEFKPPAGSWECSGCYTRNTQSNQYCVACDNPKDPSMPPKPKVSGGFSINSQTPETKATFSFGMPQNQPPANKENAGFNFSFSSKPSEKAVSSPISIFGNKSSAPSTGFNFGMQPPSTPPSSGGAVPCTFGSPGKSFDFQFNVKSPPVKSPEKAETSEDEVEESEDVYFAPVIPLPDKVDVKTGEENEDVIYCHRAKLFKFDPDTKEWKERGLGDIKLLRHQQTKRLRLLMRREQVLKICLNHAVTALLEIAAKDDKTWMWQAGDYSEGEVEYIQVACRFKTPEVAEEFKKALDDACNGSGMTNTTPGKVKDGHLARRDSSSDVQIVYETKVSEEEKAAAKKLQLPENFYAYKYKDDCPGCRGCRDSDDDATTIKPSAPIFVKANETPSTTTASVFNNVFSSKPATTTATSTTQASAVKPLFGSTAAPIFGTGSNTFGDTAAKSTGFNFQPASKPDTPSTDTGLESLKICGPSQTSITSTTSTTTSSIFGGFTTTTTPKAVFGNTASIFSTTPSTTANLFGGTATKPLFGSGDSKPVFGSGDSKPVFGDPKPVFGDPKTVFGESKPVFGESKPVFGESKSIFGEPKLGTNLFGGTATAPTTTASTTGPIFGTSTSTTPLFASANPTFGSEPNVWKQAPESTLTTTGFGAPTSTPAVSLSSTSLLGPKLTFGATNATAPANNLFAAATTQSSNLFGAKTTATTTTAQTPPTTTTTAATTEDGAKQDGVNFLPTDNAISFSDLAAKTAPAQQPAFKKDPNFAFEGAGASVFGVRTQNKATKKTPTKDSPNVKKDKTKNDDDDEEEEGEENGDDHDPYFEPIVPLPDAIEVRTGEEDEEKIFCQRAKLYRYDNNTKEWKERGVGEMKLLHHADHGTYRLLLRREQVHKIVCNLLLKPEIEFGPLSSSDRAWAWAGMNYAEPENPEIEQLAVRFKSPELAQQFKEAVEKAKIALAEKQNNEEQKYDENQAEDDYDDEDDEEYGEGDDYVDEDEEEEDDEEYVKMFEKRATVYAQNDGELNWKHLSMGNLKVIYDSEIFGARIIVENDNKELISDTVISMDTSMQCVDKECTWGAIDYALNPPVRRTLRAAFSSTLTSQEMYETFQEGQECATKADIRE